MWFAKLLDALRIKRAVWLQDIDGEITLSWIAFNSPFGAVCYRYPIYHIRPMILKPDGSIKNGSYVVSWRYYRDG